MSREDHCVRVMQYLWDEGFLHLYLSPKGEPTIRLTTEIAEVHDAIRVRFKKKRDPADWWKNEAEK